MPLSGVLRNVGKDEAASLCFLDYYRLAACATNSPQPTRNTVWSAFGYNRDFFLILELHRLTTCSDHIRESLLWLHSLQR